MDTKELIVNEALNIGIDFIGFTSCQPFVEVEEVLKDRESKGYLSGFEEKHIQKRINPKLLMEDCKTIICAGISYNVDIGMVKVKENFRHKSFVSRCTWGIDYHRVLMSKLKKLEDFIINQLKGSAKAYVDTGPLLEREVARRAGVGFIGKNCSLITKNYGSYVFIGEILTDLDIKPDRPIEDECTDCELCLKSCPTGALCSPYTVNAKKCLSYLTQSREIPYELYSKMGCNIYGCDICQNVCPRNKGVKTSTHHEFIPEEWNSYPDLIDILEMDNKTYENTFKKTSSGWRGKKNLQRNAIIAIGNSKDKEAAVYLKKMLFDGRRDIRETAIYALYNLLGKESLEILKEHGAMEKDEGIKKLLSDNDKYQGIYREG